MKKYFRVIYGFKDDFYSVDEEEMRKALKAQMTQSLVILNEGSIQGSRIVAVKPDYQRMMGWNRDYILTGEDYDYLGKRTQNECNLFIENTKRELAGLPERSKEISSGVKQLAEKMDVDNITKISPDVKE